MDSGEIQRARSNIDLDEIQCSCGWSGHIDHAIYCEEIVKGNWVKMYRCPICKRVLEEI